MRLISATALTLDFSMKPWRTADLVSACAAAFAGGIQVQAFLQQRLRVGEIDQPKLAPDRIRPAVAFHHGDGAVGCDVDVVIRRLKDDRPGGAENRVARDRHELTLVVELQAAVAGVALAGRRLHHQKGGAVDGNVQGIFGLLDGRLARNRERCRGPGRS